MPERPPEPSIEAWMNDIGRRLRDVERQRVKLPPGADPLQTFEDGSPLGDTRFLDFGAGINATLVGDDYVLVTGAGAAGCSFDAIVDGSIAASDPDQCLFMGIGEALAYLYTTVGLTGRAFVLVRGFNGTYTETADFACPSDVHLVGTGSSMLGGALGPPTWDLATFGGTNFSGLYLSDMTVTTGIKAGKSFFGTTAANAPFRVWADRVGFVGNLSSGILRLALQTTVMRNCTMVTPLIYSVNSLGISYFSETTIQMTGDSYSPCSGSSSYLYMDDVTFFGSSDLNMTLPEVAHIRCNTVNNTWVGTGTGGVLTLTSIGTSGRYDIYSQKEGIFGAKIAFSSIERCSLHGEFGDIVVGAPATGQSHHIEANRCTSLDVTGPCTLDVMCTGLMKFRGPGNLGEASTRRSGASGGTAVDFIGATDNNIQVSNAATPGAGTTKSYNFDAASSGNVLLWHNHAAYPVAGTDAGTNNRVLPEGTSPITFGGHVIEDEGTPLTQRANLNFVGAGVTAADSGGKTVVTITGSATINGHAIQDEGTPLTQRSNLNFVGSSVTVTDDAGNDASVVTISATTPDLFLAWVAL